MRKLFFLYSFIFLVFTTIACKENPIAPPPPDNGINNKEFIWTVDTLFHPEGFGMFPTGISGTSPQDVWVSAINSVRQGEIYHFDGKKWERKSPVAFFNFQIVDIKSFDEKTIFAIGFKYWFDPELRLSGVIFKYNGIKWDIVVEDVVDESFLQYIYGSNKNDIWVTGGHGVLWHYDGSVWEKEIYRKERTHGPIISFADGSAYMASEHYENEMGDTTYFYFSKYLNGVWRDIDSSLVPFYDGFNHYSKFGGTAMWGTAPNNLYNSGGAVWHYNGNDWKHQISINSIQDIKGTSENDIYAVGYSGSIGRYNGEKWYEIFEYSKTTADFLAVMPFKEEVFIGAAYRGDTYIVRGKVK